MGLVKMLYSGEDVVIPIFDHWLRRYLGENLPPSEWRNRYLELAAARNIKRGYYALAVAVLLIGFCCGCFGKSPMIWWLWSELGLVMILALTGLFCGKFFFAEKFFYRDYQQLKELIPGKELCRLEVEEVRQLAQEGLRALLFRCHSVLGEDPALKNSETRPLCRDYGQKKEVLIRFGLWNVFGDEQKSGFPAVIGIPITGVQTVPIPEG